MNSSTLISIDCALPRHIKGKLVGGLLPALLFLFNFQSLQAGSATWNLDPPNGLWWSASNWTPATVPNTISDTATFGFSNRTTITSAVGSLTGDLGTFLFEPGASAYSITFSNSHLSQPTMIGAGVMNSSGILQTFNVLISGEERDQEENNNRVSFINSATAGTLTQWTVRGSSTGAFRPAEVIFNDTATAGSSNLIVNPGGLGKPMEDGDGFGGILDFRDSSTADDCTMNVIGGVAGASNGSPPHVYFTDNATAANAVVTMTGGTGALGFGGNLDFYSNSTAASAVITNQGGAVSGGWGGQTSFWDTATAGNATLIANGGASGASGGLVAFYGSATGDAARCELFGNGTLDISFHDIPTLTIGSLEGDGFVFLGARSLAIGSNGLSTSFTGSIQDGGVGTGGSLTKIGAGTLRLSGASTHTGNTTVSAGTLVVNNTFGSATGTGKVRVNAGTLGGPGTIAGPVSVGSGNGTGAFLAPSTGITQPTSFTVQSALTFRADGTYIYKLNTRKAKADRVLANGVAIKPGAQFEFQTIGNKALRIGRTITIINNTSADPISGTFVNLPDGSTFTAGRNSFQASYSGGDGNDLTLTVVP